MASRPSLLVEDQTDEDFFDKLVDDEFLGTEPSLGLAEGEDSDEAKAIAKLSLTEVETGADDSRDEVKEDAISAGANGELDGHYAEEDKSLVPSNSPRIDEMIKSKNEVEGMDAGSDSTLNTSSDSSGLGVKEVQWNSFHADAGQSATGGFGSYSDFFGEFGDSSAEFSGKVEENLTSAANTVSGSEEHKNDVQENLFNYDQFSDGQGFVEGVDSSSNVQELSSIQEYENLYPGWKYDLNTGQWYQVNGFNATSNVQENVGVNSTTWAGSDGNSEVSYLQQTVQSAAGTLADSCTFGSVSSLNQVSQGSNSYPEHMVFDPQYPGWYYDTIAQEWRTLDAYTSSVQPTVQSKDQHIQNGFSAAGIYSHNHELYGEGGQANNQGLQSLGMQRQGDNFSGSYNNLSQQSLNTWKQEAVGINNNQSVSDFSRNQQLDNPYVSNVSTNHLVDQQKSSNLMGMIPSYDKAYRGFGNANGSVERQSFIPSANFSQHINHSKVEQQNEQMNFSNDYYASHKAENFPQQQLQNSHQFSYASNAGRSSAGHPSHALVTFGFGGKLIVMKDNGSFRNTSYGNQDPVGGSISVLDLMEVVTAKTDASHVGMGSCNYFRNLCLESFPGPLVGGNVGSKELNKWIDDRIAKSESPDMDYRKGEDLRLLLSLLKLSFQHYGKLRSPFGTDTMSRESESPEPAVAKLFASVRRHARQHKAYGAVAHCLQNFPSEGHIRATAAEVQSLLVSGRTKEALHCAQEGQLWGPALVLAAQLGDQFYVDTVKSMALRQLVPGSPLRTLCLLIAGQHADVFSADATASNGFPAPINMPQQSGQGGVNVMLDDWEENLAVITANRTKDDELVIVHLGDCLWRERSEILAAHICYLVAEANFEPYSDSARLCLIGSDHWKSPRTFASPEAIQRTELYEYSKVLGNSQFILLPFQPYKIIYAHMLAEVGKVSDALKYCQAVLKSIKIGRAPEVETWKQLVLSLEERLKTHQQGGFTTNLAPAKLVGKLLNLFDSTAQRVVGGLPPAPPTSQTNAHDTGHFYQNMGPRVSTSQSTMAMSSLMPSASMEPVSEWSVDGNAKSKHNRSVSEPDFGRTPRQADSSKEEAASNAQGNKSSGSGSSSRFVRFGFGSQLLQKTVGLVLKRPDRQAKLGEKNKFYYDEKLKRWVEEGAEPPAEEAALPPPPMSSSLHNGMSDYTLTKALKYEGSPTDGSLQSTKSSPLELSSGIPPIPPSSNQFSARGRAGVRSRYVDTFHQGNGTPTTLFQSPSVPSLKPTSNANPKFFVPSPSSSSAEETPSTIADSAQESSSANEDPSTSGTSFSFPSPAPPSSSTMTRFPSMGNIPSQGSAPDGTRRIASWSGSFTDAFAPRNAEQLKPSAKAPPSSFVRDGPPAMQLQMNGSSLGDDLQEVEL